MDCVAAGPGALSPHETGQFGNARADRVGRESGERKQQRGCALVVEAE
jgi:hypothetical protein